MAVAVQTVAVGVPCYNAAKHLHAVLSAILAQTRRPDRIYVVDDGSTDDTVLIAKSYPEVTLLLHPRNMGLAAGRNTLIREVEADVLVMLDSDAVPDPRCVEELLARFGDDRCAGVCGQAFEVSREHPADIWRDTHQFAQKWGPLPQEDVFFLLGICSAYRLEVLREVGGFNLEHKTNAEDVEMGVRLRMRGYRLGYAPGAVVYHERRDNYRSLLLLGRRYAKNTFVAVLRNRHLGWDFMAVAAWRNLTASLRKDLITAPSLRQLLISLAMSWQELRGYWEGMREMRRFTR